MAGNPQAGTHIIIAGGTSVNEKLGHDKYPLNFLDAAYQCAKAFQDGGKVVMLMFTPSYEARVRDQKDEHERVVGCGNIRWFFGRCSPLQTGAKYLNEDGTKNENYFYDLTKERAQQGRFLLDTIRSASDLTSKLDNSSWAKIATVHFFGHSNKHQCLLDYGIDGRSLAKQTWGINDAKQVSAAQFDNSALFASYGCYQGESGGLAEKIRREWFIQTLGSQGRTDYVQVGAGSIYPKSNGGYLLYPTPIAASPFDNYPPSVPTEPL